MLRFKEKDSNRIKIQRIKSFDEFLKAGAQLLGVSANCILSTSDGCDIDNDDGLIYALNEKVIVIFSEPESQQLESASKEEAAFEQAEEIEQLQKVETLPEPKTKKATGRKEKWPRNYTLPHVNEIVKLQIESCRNKEHASALKHDTSFCSALLEPIINDVQRFMDKERSLTKRQLKDIGNALLEAFPVLADSDGGWNSLMLTFLHKMKYLRSLLTTTNAHENSRQTTRGTKRNRKFRKEILRKKAFIVRNPAIDDIEILNMCDGESQMYDEEAQTTAGNHLPKRDLLMNENYRVNLTKYSKIKKMVWAPVVDVSKVENQLNSTFEMRKHLAMTMSVFQELEMCPRLRSPIFIYHEAYAVVCAYANHVRTDYLPPLNADWRNSLFDVLVRANELLRDTVVTYKRAKPFIDVVDNEDEMAYRGFMFIAAKLRNKPESFFAAGGEPVHMGGTALEPRNCVTIDGCDVMTNDLVETLAVFFTAFLCFNLNHTKQQESTLQCLEGVLGIRKRFARDNIHALVRRFF